MLPWGELLEFLGLALPTMGRPSSSKRTGPAGCWVVFGEAGWLLGVDEAARCSLLLAWSPLLAGLWPSSRSLRTRASSMDRSMRLRICLTRSRFCSSLVIVLPPVGTMLLSAHG